MLASSLSLDGGSERFEVRAGQEVKRVEPAGASSNHLRACDAVIGAETEGLAWQGGGGERKEGSEAGGSASEVT